VYAFWIVWLITRGTDWGSDASHLKVDWRGKLC